MPITLPPVPVIEDSPEGRRAAQKAAIDHCRDNFAGKTYTNLSSGDVIAVSSQGIKHTLHIAMPPLVRAMYLLPQILEQAEKTGEVLDKLGRPDIAAVHKYEMEMVDGAAMLLALVVARRHRNGTITFYDLSFLKR